MAYYTARYFYTTVRTRLEFSETDLRTVRCELFASYVPTNSSYEHLSETPPRSIFKAE